MNNQSLLRLDIGSGSVRSCCSDMLNCAILIQFYINKCLTQWTFNISALCFFLRRLCQLSMLFFTSKIRAAIMRDVYVG